MSINSVYDNSYNKSNKFQNISIPPIIIANITKISKKYNKYELKSENIYVVCLTA